MKTIPKIIEDILAQSGLRDVANNDGDQMMVALALNTAQIECSVLFRSFDTVPLRQATGQNFNPFVVALESEGCVFDLYGSVGWDDIYTRHFTPNHPDKIIPPPQWKMAANELLKPPINEFDNSNVYHKVCELAQLAKARELGQLIKSELPIGQKPGKKSAL